MPKPSKKQIKQLLKSGFDPDLISFELGISIEQIKLLQGNNNQNLTGKKREISSYDNFMIMKKSYRQLYFDVGDNGKDSEIKKEITPDERKILDELITKIQKRFNSMNKDLTKINNAFELLNEIGEIGNYQLSIEQAEQLISVLQSPIIKELKITDYNYTTKYHSLYVKAEKIISNKFIQAVDTVQSETTNIEKLEELKKRLESNPFREYCNSISEGVKRKIRSKIEKYSNQTRLNGIKNDIPQNILEIVKKLSEGKLDIESAKKTINKEVNRRMQSGVKNKFSLTEEQEKNQILFQIRTALEERAELYNITDPEKTINQLHYLCGDSLYQSVSSVVENLINSSEFKKAKEVYEKFITKNQTDDYSNSMEHIRKRIRNAEIGDMVLREIKLNKNDDRQCAYFFEQIEKRLKTGNVNMKAIPLGKSESGLRTITLADVWPDKERKNIKREVTI